MSMLAAFAALGGITLDDFKAVHKAQVEREGANCVRVRFPSAEWGSGIKWESAGGADFSSAKWLAADVENLSKT
ncbi:MAG: hypothetical protein IKQ17_02925, partial [Kiritimatiellae bacterium]|nr:hypothetical protein [Kiritimatiellia bacterium]